MLIYELEINLPEAPNTQPNYACTLHNVFNGSSFEPNKQDTTEQFHLDVDWTRQTRSCPPLMTHEYKLMAVVNVVVMCCAFTAAIYYL